MGDECDKENYQQNIHEFAVRHVYYIPFLEPEPAQNIHTQHDDTSRETAGPNGKQAEEHAINNTLGAAQGSPW